MDSTFIKRAAIFIIAGLCISFSSVFAQWQWAVRGGGGYRDYSDPNWVCSDKNGNAFFVGGFMNTAGNIDGQSTSNLASINYCGLIMKYSSAGEKKWIKYFGNDGGWGVQVRGAATDNMGNVYVTGSFEYTMIIDNDTLTASGGASDGSFNIFLCKISPDGKLLWLRRIGAPFDDVYTFFQAPLRISPSGAILILGQYGAKLTAGDTTISSHSGSADIFLASYTKDGELDWIKSYGSEADDTPTTFDVDADGNIYVTATYNNRTSTDFGGIIVNAKAKDSTALSQYMVKLDPQGKALWVRTEGILQYVKTTPAGVINYGIFSGQLVHGESVVSSHGIDDIAIVRYSSDGIFQSVNSFGGDSTNYATSLGVAPNGDLYCGFITWGPITILGDRYGTPEKYLYSFLLHLDPKGNILQYSKLPPLVRPLYAALNASGSAMLVAGQFDSSATLVTGKTLVSIPNCNDFFFGEFSFMASSSVRPEIAHQNLSLYPDPANSFITITLPEDWDVSGAVLTIMNSIGAGTKTITLSKSIINTNGMKIDIFDMASGMYTYSLHNAQRSASGSFIVAH
jgi:hypothetical protein